MKKTIIVSVALLIVIVGVFYFMRESKAPISDVMCTQEAKQCPDGSYVGRTGPNCEFSTCPLFDGKLVSDVYPMYGDISWEAEEKVVKELQDQKFSGYEKKSKKIEGVSNLAEVFGPFQQYYSDKLITSGWVQNINYSADGPGSSLWVYEKEGKYIIFSYHSTAVNKALNAPMSCPCDMEFSIFTGEMVIGK